MNVMIYNKYKDLLMGLNIEVMKSLEGVYNVDEIIDTFTNFYYDKMILDITAIRDYQNTDNLQKLAMNINMENVILLLDDSPEMDSKAYLSKLISLGIYNFTVHADGIDGVTNFSRGSRSITYGDSQSFSVSEAGLRKISRITTMLYVWMRNIGMFIIVPLLTVFLIASFVLGRNVIVI